MRSAIPFVKPWIGEEEKQAVVDALDRCALGGNGEYSKRVEKQLAEILNARYVLLTTSCSHAMEMAAMALGLQPGDQVIMPSFTFVTTASSVVRQGACPVFVDIDERTLNIDPNLIEERITPATRAILPVHYAGHACSMDDILEIARHYDLFVIEDAAQGLGAKFEGQALGTFGDIGCFSFHVTKNVVGGECGAFVTDHPEIATKAEIIREKGTNRSQFLRGQVDKYTWVDIGSSFVPSDLLAAILDVQLAKMPAIQAQRERLWHRYDDELSDLEDAGILIRPHIDENVSHNWHIYAVQVVDVARRNEIIDELRRRGIGATFHFIPLHSSPYARQRWGYRPEDLPITERVAKSLIRLPLFPELDQEDQSFIIDAIHEVCSVPARRVHAGAAT